MEPNTRFGASRAEADDADADKLLAQITTGQPAAEGIPPVAPPPESEPISPEQPDQPVAPAKPVEPSSESDKSKIIEALQNALSVAKNDFRALKGKFDKEVPRYAAEIKGLKEEISSLKTQLAEAQAKPVAPTAPARPNVKLKQLQEDLGIDDKSAQTMSDIINDQVTAGIQAALDSLSIKPGVKPAEIPAAAAAQPAASAKTASDKSEPEQPNLSDASWAVFNSYLPDFAKSVYEPHVLANGKKGSPEINAFFSERDGMTGLTYGQMAYNATADDDPVRLANIYSVFKEYLAKPGRPDRPLAPHTGGKGGQGITKPKPTYSRKDADAFMKEYQKNVGNYSPEELAKATKTLGVYEAAELQGRLI